MTAILVIFQRSDRLSSAGTFYLPHKQNFSPILHISLPRLRPRRLVHRLHHLRFPCRSHPWEAPAKDQKAEWGWSQVLFSWLPPCHLGLAVTVYLRLQLSPGNLSFSSLLHTQRQCQFLLLTSSRVLHCLLLVFLNLATTL